MTDKNAVVVGIQSTHGMKPLPGAAAGARRFGTWLEGAGYRVHRFIDADGDEVTRAKLFAKVAELVKARQTRSLVVYFAGHGVAQTHTRNLWFMPVGVPDDPTEAVNLELSLSHARASGIEHIAIIADACRTAAGKSGLSIDGASIFPARGSGGSELDTYLSSQLGQASYELIPDSDLEADYGVFTNELLAALEGGSREAAVYDANAAEERVTAGSLADHLRYIVPRKAAGLAKRQVPNCPTESDHVWAAFPLEETAEVSIAVTVEGPPAPGDVDLTLLRYVPRDDEFVEFAKAAPAPARSTLPRRSMYKVDGELAGYEQAPEVDETLFHLTADVQREIWMRPPGAGALPSTADVARPTHATSRVVDERGARLAEAPAAGVYMVETEDLLTGRVEFEPQYLAAGARPRAAAGLAADDGAESLAGELASVEGRRHFETGMGISVVGSAVQAAAVAPGGHEGVFEEGPAWHVRGKSDTNGSAVIALGGALYAALAVYRGLIGTVTVRDERIVQLTYWPAYDEPPDVIRRELSLISMAALRGRFEVALGEAEGFAERVRRFKHADQALGVFAAYAYHRAGRPDKILDMARYYRKRHQPIPFDLYLLSGLSRDEFESEFFAPDDVPVVIPSFPLLTQGWSYLTDDSTFHPTVAMARETLAPSLFAMPTGDGGRLLMEAIEAGELP